MVADGERAWTPARSSPGGPRAHALANHGDDVTTPDNSNLVNKLLAALALAIAVTVVLVYGKLLLMPLAFGGLLALLVAPIGHRLVKWGAPRWLGLTAAVAAPALAVAALAFAIGHQAVRFADDWSKIQERVQDSVSQLEERLPSWTERVPGVDALLASAKAQEPENAGTESDSNKGETSDDKRDDTSVENSDENNVENSVDEASNKTPSGAAAAPGSSSVGGLSGIPISGEQLMGPLSKTVAGVMIFGLMFVYLALFLLEEQRLRGFVLRRAEGRSGRARAEQILAEISDVAQHYLLGRLMVIGALTALYGIGFSIGGLQYALFIALFAAALSIVPYFGNIIGGGLAVLVALAGDGGQTPMIAVLVTMVLAQLIENYILTPFVVGSEVNVNPLVTVVSVIAFTLIWGPVGAVVAIPLVALVRIVCLHVDGLKDYAYLLGNDDACRSSDEGEGEGGPGE